MIRPVRLQLSRKKGFDLQAHSQGANGLPAVNVARPSRWGNPYAVGAPDPFRPIGNWMSQERAVELYRRGIELRFVTVPFTRLTPEERGDKYHSFGAHSVEEVSHQLRGKNLACWCKPGEPCHADVLLELANGPRCEEA
ncbi:DUF4326 domain-containing protein [Nitratireductor sp. GCM10026969]|uniref:DUF4326 domain-containing protein n=1 Tax=Nitratireductor sp. GCM10026969 TaxID=3252645 RepID=UPI00360F5CCE